MDGCLCRGPVGEPGEGVRLQRTVRDSGRRAPEMELLSLQELCLGKPGGVEEGAGDGHLFPWGPHWETWESAHMPGAYVWKMVLGWVSLHTRAPLGDLGRGPCTGNFERWMKGALGMGHLSLKRLTAEGL